MYGKHYMSYTVRQCRIGIFPTVTEAPVATIPAAIPKEKLAEDTPRTTTEGSRFIEPAGWSITVRGAATILSPPEDGNWIALVDVHAPDTAGDKRTLTIRDGQHDYVLTEKN
jgi:hypothetical protein